MTQRIFGPTDQAEKYRIEAIQLLESFEYELCSECGKDADQHVIAPDVLGLPHLYCLRGQEISATLKFTKRCVKCHRIIRRPMLAAHESERCAKCGDS